MRLALFLLLSACSTTQIQQASYAESRLPIHPMRERIQPLLDEAESVGGNLSAEIQVRLDPLADPFSDNQEIRRYWIDTTNKEKIVYVETLDDDLIIFILTINR